MTQKRVPGWTYAHSDLLNQDFAFRPDNKGGYEVYTEDKTHYTWSEINLIKHKGGLPTEVHLLKKVFSGDIIA